MTLSFLITLCFYLLFDLNIFAAFHMPIFTYDYLCHRSIKVFILFAFIWDDTSYGFFCIYFTIIFSRMYFRHFRQPSKIPGFSCSAYLLRYFCQFHFIFIIIILFHNTVFIFLWYDMLDAFGIDDIVFIIFAIFIYVTLYWIVYFLTFYWYFHANTLSLQSCHHRRSLALWLFMIFLYLYFIFHFLAGMYAAAKWRNSYFHFIIALAAFIVVRLPAFFIYFIGFFQFRTYFFFCREVAVTHFSKSLRTPQRASKASFPPPRHMYFFRGKPSRYFYYASDIYYYCRHWLSIFVTLHDYIYWY